MFGLLHFYHYLYGRKFTLVTDHKSLITIFRSMKGILYLTAARLQHWEILLLGYRYENKFRSTHQHCNADALARLPLDVKDSNSGSEAT